jgi:hypothetical protein
MTARDLAWRIGGAALFGLACAIGQSRSVSSSDGIDTLFGLVAFVLAIAGVVLLVQGKRIPMAFRVERSGHRNLVAAVHSRRQRRARDADRTAR